MDAHPFGWLPASRIAAIEQRLDGLLRRWLAEWSLAASAALLAPDTATATDGFDRLYSRAGAHLGLAFAAGTPAQLGTWLAAMPGGHEGLLARELGDLALADLAGRLLGLPAGESPARLAGSHAAASGFAPRRRAARWQLKLGALEFGLALDADAAAALAPPPATAPRPPLTRRSDALAHSRAPLSLQLPLGEVPLADFIGLSAGDVLVCAAPLNTPFRLMSGSEALPFDCRLVRANDRRAAFLDSQVTA